MKILAIVVLTVCVFCNQHLNDKYHDVLHGRNPIAEDISRQIYGQFKSVYSLQSESRYQIFSAKLEEMRQHNLLGLSWTQGINDYSDLTFEEFMGLRLMAPQNCSATQNLKLKESARSISIPDEHEWSSLGMVTPVKNQGNCGSCWTFSTVGAMESHWNILGKGKNLTFSEQQLVDCAGGYNNHGCNGGLPSQAFEYIRSIPSGLESDKTYPYTGRDGKCVYRPQNGIAYLKYGAYNITQGNETELAERLYSVGPISIAFEVITGFQSYRTGVYTTTKCGKTTKDINHAVLATGYGF